MIYLSSILAVVVVLLLATSGFADTQTDGVGQARTIQGYATGCTSVVHDEIPVLQINLYLTAKDAQASKTSEVKPQTVVVLEYGSGSIVMNLNPESFVRLICGAIEAHDPQKPILVRANAENIVERVGAYGHILQSDSYALMSPVEKKAIDILAAALMATQSKLKELSERIPPGRGA